VDVGDLWGYCGGYVFLLESFCLLILPSAWSSANLLPVMLFFAFGAPWGWKIKPGEYTTATVAIVPLAIQICSATFLPFFLGLN
jgi:hypothetical protein